MKVIEFLIDSSKNLTTDFKNPPRIIKGDNNAFAIRLRVTEPWSNLTPWIKIQYGEELSKGQKMEDYQYILSDDYTQGEYLGISFKLTGEEDGNIVSAYTESIRFPILPNVVS